MRSPTINPQTSVAEVGPAGNTAMWCLWFESMTLAHGLAVCSDSSLNRVELRGLSPVVIQVLARVEILLPTQQPTDGENT